MKELNLAVTIYGFWDDFRIESLPKDGKIYFVFAGNIIDQNRCRLLRTVRIGVGISTVDRSSSIDLNPGELLFYAVGDAPDEGIEELVFALQKQFTPSLISEEDAVRFKGLSLKVHMDGKLPGIYAEFSDFALKIPEGGAR
jgi:hypothetical protein